MKLLAKLFDDGDKTVNPVHIVTLMLVLAVIAWGSYVVIKTEAMPELTGAAYLLGGAGAANIAHKAEDIVNSIKKPTPPLTGGEGKT